MRTGLGRSRIPRRWARAGVWLLECCAATATAWLAPYDPAFWRDWRTDVLLGHLDVELRLLLDSSQSDALPPLADP